MWRQLKSLSNYVVVEVKGGCVERFINLCRFNGICMWDICNCHDYVKVNMSKKDFMKIKTFVIKSGVHIRILKKQGAGFMAFRYRKHYSFLLGTFISMVLVKIMSLYVWNISFTGNTEYTDELLIKYLKEQAYDTGMKIKDIDCDGIESSMRNQFENITWVSAQISGTRLIIHIKENDGTRQVYDYAQKQQSSLYADYDGTVVSIITRSGTPMVKVGDTVTVGQEIVSGYIELCNDAGEVVSIEEVGADAKVVIRTEIPYTDTVLRNREEKVYTGRTKSRKIIGVADKSVKLGFDFKRFQEYDCVTESSNMKLSQDFCLPVWYGECMYYEYNLEPVQLTDSQLELQLKNRLIAYLHKLEQNNVQIYSNRVNIKLDSNSGIMDGIIEAEVTEGSNSRQ